MFSELRMKYIGSCNGKGLATENFNLEALNQMIGWLRKLVTGCVLVNHNTTCSESVWVASAWQEKHWPGL